MGRKLRSNYSGIHLKGLSRRSSYSPGLFSSYRISRALDTSISVRSLMKYLGITAAFIIIFVSIFMLGRISAADEKQPEPSKSSQLSGTTKQIPKEDTAVEVTAEAVAEKPDAAEDPLEEDEVSDPPKAVPATEQPAVEEVPEPAKPLPPPCENTVAGFDHAYRNVVVEVSNFQRELKGDNWGTLTSVKLTVTNNETCTIVNPTKAKLKLNPKYKGSVWWDDDVFLPESFLHMLPGQTVTEVIPVHASYSDIYAEKDFKLTVFDDYDIAMGTYKNYITLP